MIFRCAFGEDDALHPSQQLLPDVDVQSNCAECGYCAVFRPSGGLMASRNRPKRAAVRGKSAKTHYASGLAEIVSETVRLWRKHHLGYDQTKYVVEQARRRLKLQSPATRRRTVNRLDKSEV